MAAELSSRIVLAGEIIEELSDLEESVKIILGPGLRSEANKVLATKCGLLRKKGNSTYWIDNHQKRYIPVRGDCVLGIVIAKAGDIFKVDIGSSDCATLSYLSFEGATKRNRPNVQIGDIVFAKLIVASKDMEPELVCIDRHGKSSGFGVPSEGGFIFQVPLHLIRKILSPSCSLMKSLGARFRFESAIGMNGRIWLKGRNIQEVIAISNAISLAEHMTNDEIELMCKKLGECIASF